MLTCAVVKPPLSPISPFSLRPIPTAPVPLPIPPPLPSPVSSRRLSTGTHPTLPDTLQDDIKRFAASEYARRFFSQRRRGFWFLKRRKVPVDEMMRWQRGPLDGPLLVMNGSLHKDAIAAFKVVQRVMGDRDPLKPVGVRLPSHPSFRSLASSSPSSSFSSNSTGWIVTAGDGTSIIEEERWLLQAGISYIELRDEIYCQVMKQLTENPNTESAFRGWQLLCVLIVTFPPSKYFEDHLTFFLQSSMQNTEGKVDVMAAYCLRRKEIIMWKGPRGKAPSLEEIEAASDAAFHPSVFGESLPLIMSLQATVYPPSEQPVPIILPFLCSGILALGGMKEEGIFRLPGDTDAVASLRLRIERGHYHLEGVEDPHVCASLMKSWLRELREPVIPEGETYNLALQAAASDDPQRVIDIVRHLPEPNRRVLLHVISYLQMFTADEVVEHTKMTEEGLSRVMTPNLIRGRTGDLDVAFRNNHFENIFVGMLLRHMDCSTIDPGYRPMHWRA
ncbi:Rho GTPase activation protein [Calocera cornea HHB12733]|uniref:Rho GTPase activation protein n=1 Tax=Calocera cornea HHB12733 TaxID=1353952 RepID=A0A165FF38_9BASI|nr:Rho GTPase activation protein [Calocera cornea HHB12733]